MVEAKYPAVVERYVNLGRSYDAAGLQDVREEIMGAMEGYPACYQRAYRCLGAAERLREDMRSALLTDAAGEKLAAGPGASWPGSCGPGPGDRRAG